MIRNISLSLLIVLTSIIFAQSDPKIIGYFTSWSVYGRNYHIDDIPAEKITHINYAFANISTDGNVVLGDSYADIDKFYPGDSWDTDSLRGSFHRLILLKNEYPNLKTMISIGGWTWSTYFSDVAATEASRNQFAESCVDFITEYQFDGVDLDWEYPVEGGLAGTHHSPEDKENYTLLAANIREKLDNQTLIDGKEYYLSIAAPADISKAENIELNLISEYLDWINIMTYDYHGPWGGDGDAVTNFNAPLYASSNPLGEPFHSSFNINSTVEYYLSSGVPSEKINLGLAYYGRGYGNVASSEDGLYQTYSGASPLGTWENGVFDYDDLHENYIDMGGYTRYWHDEAQVPWLYNPSNNVMISYDDTISIGIKANFICDNNLGGAMFWEFSEDDDHVLLNKTYQVLNECYTGVCEIPFNNSNLEISIMPNPSTSTIKINTTDAERIEIYDISGRKVHEKMLNSSSNQNSYSWTPSVNSHNGIFFARITFSDKIICKKISLIR